MSVRSLTYHVLAVALKCPFEFIVLFSSLPAIVGMKNNTEPQRNQLCSTTERRAQCFNEIWHLLTEEIVCMTVCIVAWNIIYGLAKGFICVHIIMPVFRVINLSEQY